jgi:HAD superfamily hydrolase (TIGR01459 family)
VGLFDEADPLDGYDPLFAAARVRGAPMICVNPDLVVHRQTGIMSPCAGLLAQRYREQGGRVIYHGKPDSAIFHRTARALGRPEDARILVVGDSLATDIKGATAAGYDSLLVTRGIHAQELGITPGNPPDPDRLATLYARHGLFPSAAIATLRW